MTVTDPATIDAQFAATARRAAAAGLDGEAARVDLVLGLPEEVALEHALRLYWQGDTGERLAVLRALPHLDEPSRSVRIGDGALPVVRDALRTNDSRLVAAAMGPYAADHLDDAAWRQAVLKLIFMGAPLTAVADLDRRADDELVRMVRDFATERQAAGRPVPPDAVAILTRSPSHHDL